MRVFVQRVHGGRWPVRAWTPRSPRRQAYGKNLKLAVRGLARKLGCPVTSFRLKETISMSMPLKRQECCWHLRDKWGYPLESFFSRYSYGDRVLVMVEGRWRFGKIVAAQLDRDGNFVEWLVEGQDKRNHTCWTARKQDPNYPVKLNG